MEALNHELTVELTVGHVLVLWDLLQGKLSQLHKTHELSAGEKRALWALEDICEESLISAGYSSLPSSDWENILKEARKYAESIPADCVE